jgi:hypothetical protein
MKKPSPKLNTERLKQVRNRIPPVPRRFKKVKGEERIQEAFENIPRITNETVAEHREHVLKGARKYKYPLQHSKHRIVIISTGLIIAAIVGFFAYTLLALYKFQSTSSFTYRITQIIPFPIARAGGHFVAYENYLFEVRRYEHYYQTQQRVDFASKDGRRQLDRYKPVAMSEVVQAAYTKQLAAQNHVSVSSKEIDEALQSLEAQNQSSEQALADVTNKFFGWSLDDLRREVKQELLAQKVANKLDVTTHSKAASVLSQLQGGADFATVAKANSDAPDKENGGQFADQAITSASTDVPPAVVRELQNMQVNQTSSVIEAGSTLEIVKLLANDNGKFKAAHISFGLTPIDHYVGDYKKNHPQHVYIKID